MGDQIVSLKFPFFSDDNSLQDRESIIFVEGVDDAYFISTLLLELQADEDKVGILKVDGTGNFPRALRAYFKSPNFSQGKNKSIAIICDADENPNYIKSEINIAFQQASQPALINGNHVVNEKGLKFGLFLMPDSTNTGDLELLCLSTVEGSTIEQYSENFISEAYSHATSQQKTVTGSRNKRKAQVYLAGISHVLSRGAGRGFSTDCFDKAHSNLNPIREFLEKTIRI
jgi:hypothetical protein